MCGRKASAEFGPRTGLLARRLIPPLALATLLLRSPWADAASFAPGVPQPQAPTGTPAQPDTQQDAPAAEGIRWELAPLRYSGAVSYDYRTLRLESGARSSQHLVFNDIDFATHIWQPWFVQLRAGLGTIAARDTSSGKDAPGTGSSSASLTGRLAMTVFPVSRFPFELRADLADSRARGDNYGVDYRSRRFSLSQAYSPETGNDNYNFNLDRSRISTLGAGDDTLTSVRASALRQFGEHAFELTASLSNNARSDTDARSQLASLNGRHTFQDANAWHVDTLASWNESRLRSVGAAGAVESDSTLRQVSTFATWRPQEGQWLYSATSPIYLNGSLRLADTSTGNGTGAPSPHLYALTGSLGASQELTPEWRANAGLAGSLLSGTGTTATRSSATASTTYSPIGLMWGAWRYAPSVGASLAMSSSNDGERRHAIGTQASHSLSRSHALGESESLGINLSQSVGLGKESQSPGLSHTLAHSAAVSWQGGSDPSSQGYAALTVSDSRSWARESGSFQLLNLQVTRRTQLTRDASWSGNLTLQASRSASEFTDPLATTPTTSRPGWQRFYSGSLSYEDRRIFAIPRLQFTALLTLNSQQLESRAAGDIDAPRERISRSVEARLDYAIGRLETRLTARSARVDGRSVASLFLRVQRSY